MLDRIEGLVRESLRAAQDAGELPALTLEDAGIERPADTTHGDWTSTVALRCAKLAGRSPRAIAQTVISHLPADPAIARVEIAGPGFINFFLSSAARNAVLEQARAQGADFGRSNVGAGLKTQVEFVSANPVGPMHVGHGRWAALGDSLCRVMEHAGYDIEREYYVNDHGVQMGVFGRSISLRYVQLAEVMAAEQIDVDAALDALRADRAAALEDESGEHPELHPLSDAFFGTLGADSYGGDYIIEEAAAIMREDGARWLDISESQRAAAFRERGYRRMLDEIRTLCHDVRCDFDVWFSESTLYEKASTGPDAGTSPVDRAFARLDEMGYLYERDDALWFRSTDLGDDKDRVLVKSNGDYTYFASDVAYHWDKFQRVDHVIDIWGSDHHGYIQRVSSACTALGYPGRFEVVLGQLVNLLRSGKPVRMSKRKGTMVTFRELVDEVGADATRYTLISRSSNQTIDFDIDAVKERSMDNPVYYVQYAHARICSILRRAARVDEREAAQAGMDVIAASAIGQRVDYSLLSDPTELALSRKISELPELIVSCARDRAPFRLTHFAEELAASFHSFYAACQVLPSASHPLDAELSRARLACCDAVRSVLALVLSLIGVSAPASM